MDPVPVLDRQARPPDLVLAYGAGHDQVANLHLPAPAGRAGDAAAAGAPLVLFLHGGFWRARYGREHTAPLAEALTAAGFVTCAPEYRRTGRRHGGWPRTFDDVALAVDRLPALIARETGWRPGNPLVLAGHSAGGHLALWAAGRHRLPPDSPWRSPPAPISGVVALAAVCDLAAGYELNLGAGAVAALMGGGPRRRPERYRAADPAGLLPLAGPAWLLHGAADDIVPPRLSTRYATACEEAGTAASCVLLPGTGHFELIDPLSGAWPAVLDAFRAAAGQHGAA